MPNGIVAYLASGYNSVNISGSIAGVSGQSVYLASGQNGVQISGQGVWIYDALGGAIFATLNSNGWQGALTVATLSGSVTQISGQSVRLTDFGGIALAATSTNPAYAFALNVATTSGSVTQISGQTVYTVPAGVATVRTAPVLVVTSLSGGTTLPSLVGDKVTVRMDPDATGRMYLGSTTNPPLSGTGFKLSPGDGYTAQVSNANVLQIFATVSGEKAFVIAEDT